MGSGRQARGWWHGGPGYMYREASSMSGSSGTYAPVLPASADGSLALAWVRRAGERAGLPADARMVRRICGFDL